MNSFESGIIEAIQRGATAGWDGFFRVVTVLGDWAIVLIAAAIILLFFGAKQLAKYGSVVVVATALTQLLKYTVRRQRPFEFSDEIVAKVTETGFSFPSGHTITATVTAIFLCVCICKILKNRWWKGAVTALFALCVALVAFSRVYLGVHYISDVVTAVALGAVVYVIIGYVFEKTYKAILPKIKT